MYDWSKDLPHTNAWAKRSKPASWMMKRTHARTRDCTCANTNTFQGILIRIYHFVARYVNRNIACGDFVARYATTFTCESTNQTHIPSYLQEFGDSLLNSLRCMKKQRKKMMCCILDTVPEFAQKRRDRSKNNTGIKFCAISREA